MTAHPQPTSPRRRPSGPVLALVVLGVLAAAYVGAAAWFGDTVPRGTTVGGVAVGGLSSTEAEAAVRTEVDRAHRTPVTVSAGSASFTIAPESAGLTADVGASIDGLTGFSLAPSRVWAHVVGGGEQRPIVTTADHSVLTDAVAAAGAAVNTPAKEGSLRIDKDQVRYVAPVAGRTLDPRATADRIVAAWPARNRVEGSLTPIEPKTPASAYAAARDFADKVVAGPVVVDVGSTTFDVPAGQLSPAVGFAAQGGKVTHTVDPKKVTAAVQAVAKEKGIDKPAKNAVVSWVDGGPRVAPSQNGQALKGDVIPAQVTTAFTAADRTARIPLVATQPKLTTEKAKASLPKGLISSFTTHFTTNPVRTTNLRIAAARLNNTYVAPGETFSLNAHLGKRTPEKGYQKAQVIYDGRLTYDYGGGISQVSTTLFNAIFFSGAQIDQYLPHSFYISRYPVGREATISWPNVDNRFTNTTDGGILIKSWLSGNDITVQFYGVKTWDVDAITGPRRNIVKPKVIRDDSPTCVPQAPSEGFDITVTRVFTKNGAEVRRQDFTTHYIPEDEVVCKTPYQP